MTEIVCTERCSCLATTRVEGATRWSCGYMEEHSCRTISTVLEEPTAGLSTCNSLRLVDMLFYCRMRLSTREHRCSIWRRPFFRALTKSLKWESQILTGSVSWGTAMED